MAHDRHRFPRCPKTGKRRLGEYKDIRLALRAARYARWTAQLHGVPAHRHEIRGYHCTACNGWHLTSQPNKTPAGPGTAFPARPDSP